MKIYAIAKNTFKEVIRDRIFYSLVFFALLILGASVLLSALTIGERTKIIEDISLAGINLFGVVISIFVGIGLVSKELEKKTIYTIVSKPISRWEFLLGKYMGLAMTLLVYVALMSGCFLGALYLDTRAWGGLLMPAVLMIYFELLIVTAAALLFSTFSTPTLSATYTLAVYVIGHLTGDLKGLAGRIGNPALAKTLEALYYILPNLEDFNLKGQVVHGQSVPAGIMLMSMSYGLLYVIVILALAMIVFQRRNFK